MSLTEKQFEQWLSAYGKAWESKDEKAFSFLFDDGAIYYWTPFDDPQKGPAEIGKAFSAAIANQSEIEFGARVLYTQAQLGAAHWSCSFTRVGAWHRVHVDGVLVVQLTEDGKALSFREWWHSDER